MDILKPLRVAASYIARKAAADAERQGGPATSTYDQYRGRNWLASSWQKRPPFSITWADLMVVDHQVAFGLSLGNAPLKMAEVEVEGSRTDVVKFVQDQWQRIWDRSFSAIVSAKHYGYLGYEVLYKLENGRYEFDRLLDRHPWDVRPQVNDVTHKLVGVSFTGLRGLHAMGKVTLPSPAALWLTHKAKYGSWFGDSCLEPSFNPWYEKTMDAGASRMRQLRMIKDAWIGDRVYYDKDEVFITPDGITLPAQALAAEVIENRYSGGTLCLPKRQNPTGPDYKILEYEGPTPVAGATQIMEWVHDLDWDIFDGLLIPREIVEAASSGSGFSGRSIPFLNYLVIRDEEFGSTLRQIDEQLMRPLVAVNFGAEAGLDYQIKPKPLLDSVGKLMGDMGKPDTMQDHGQPPQLQQQQRERIGGPEQAGGRFGAGKEQPGRPATQFSDEPAEAKVHEFSSTQFNLNGQLASDILELGFLVNADDLADDGREQNPHITVKFGLHTNDPEDLRRIVEQLAPVAVQLGECSFFAADAYDVVKIDVESKALHKLNAAICEGTPCTDTHPEYKPHVTIAYVKSGMGDHYARRLNAMQGRVAVFDRIIFSDKLRRHTSIPLTGAAQFAVDDKEAGSKWITIGGRQQGDRKHAGGFPVQIDSEGRILKSGGLQSLVGKKLSGLKRHFAGLKKKREKEQSSFDPTEFEPKRRAVNEKSEIGSAIHVAAKEHDLHPGDLAEAVDVLWKEKRDAVLEYEKAKQGAREITGLTRGRINAWEDAGHDYSSWPSLDEAATEVAGTYPELGLGRLAEGGGYDSTDYAAKLWHILKEGKREPPTKAELIDEAAAYVAMGRIDESLYDEMRDVQFAEFDESKHPKAPAGAPGSTGGQFIRTRGAGFASQEVRENLTFEQAIESLATERQSLFRERSWHLDGELLLPTREIHDTIGSWVDPESGEGAEPSTLSVYGTGLRDIEELEYAMAWRGLMASQKGALPFMAKRGGNNSLYTIQLPDTMEEVRLALDDLGIQNRTLRTTESGLTIVNVVDFDGSLASSIAELGNVDGTKIKRIAGEARLIGGTSREEAREDFKRLISRYESRFLQRRHYRGVHRERWLSDRAGRSGAAAEGPELTQMSLASEPIESLPTSLSDTLTRRLDTLLKKK